MMTTALITSLNSLLILGFDMVHQGHLQPVQLIVLLFPPIDCCVFHQSDSQIIAIFQSTKIDWVWSGFGADPTTVQKIILKLEKHANKYIDSSDVLLAFNWLKYDDTEKLLAGCYSFMRKESGTKPGA
jgi:hypothetical protein